MSDAPETTHIGMDLIRAERQRQIDSEGYTREHDAEHGTTVLTSAAGHYRAAGPEAWKQGPPRLWPWEASAWKPRDPISNLIRAGALYLAAADLGNPYAERNARECADIIDACRSRLATPPACENSCERGTVACWSPGGPCPADQTICESCGPCSICRPGAHPLHVSTSPAGGELDG